MLAKAKPSCLIRVAVCLALAANAFAVPARADAVVGDRLVLAINNVPYTQRQVETYVTVKESLRKTNDGTVRVVDARNWSDAMAAFTEDTIILQEAQRLGSFAAADGTVEKFGGLVHQKIARGGDLAATLTRLGIDEQTLMRTLDTVLRVAAFRRSKDRQEAQSAGPRAAAARKPAGGGARWLGEVVDRAIVRQFEGAGVYVVIQPAAGRGGNAR